ncbi:Mitochondrial distribution and morphology protein 10 [Saxophila tyrrhenica]|uniref:Mitochondrial distribution and morphology protein 10 n=1 Tax=Saxophila tyrrhenica TaxID=1690608 RepID=A0AAV9P4J5_9PEZI|nr:Mitochondrial distribution and morphology protein 10 [Saxophila tyrrhenica]
MRDFMDYVLTAFHHKTGWNVDNSYASLTTTANNLLDFNVPHGLSLHVSSLSSPNFATSYTLGSKGVVDGSLSFLYTSLGLNVTSRSSHIPLANLVRGYRHLQHLSLPKGKALNDVQDGGTSIAGDGRKDTLLYGRLYLPSSSLEALYLRRLSPNRLLRLNCVSDATLPSGGTVLALLQNDFGKYTTEYLYSTDSSLLGFRALYNFGYDPRYPLDQQHVSSRPARHPWDHQNGRLSAGAEAYFSPINKSGGISTGLRFTTLPIHTGFPYTMTLTLNPLMGNLSSSYAVKAGPNLSLCSRFDFNVYSYESDVSLGLELWQLSRPRVPEEVAWVKDLIRPGWEPKVAPEKVVPDEDVTGVLKARMTDKGKVGVVWECRLKELLVTLGAGLDLKKRDSVVGKFGLEVAYSS